LAFALQLRKKHGKTSVRVAIMGVNNRQTIARDRLDWRKIGGRGTQQTVTLEKKTEVG
jgi:hypothetical protein